MIPPFLKKTSWQRSTPLLFRIDMSLIKLNRRCWRTKRVSGEDTVAVQPPYYATPRPTTSHSALKLVDQRRAASRHILPQVATIRQDQAVNKRRESLLWTLATDRNVTVMATSRLAIAVQFPTKAQQCQFQRTAAKLKSIESICNNAFLTTQRNNSSISCLSQVEDNKVSTNPLSTLVHGVLLVFTTMHPILPPAIRLRQDTLMTPAAEHFEGAAQDHVKCSVCESKRVSDIGRLAFSFRLFEHKLSFLTAWSGFSGNKI